MALAHRTARAGPSKVARIVEPASDRPPSDSVRPRNRRISARAASRNSPMAPFLRAGPSAATITVTSTRSGSIGRGLACAPRLLMSVR